MAFVSTYVFINPIVALWLGWLVLAERITTTTVLATVVILGGLALTRLPDWPEALRWDRVQERWISSGKPCRGC